jgi:SAM-dependent methyltransferase
LVRNLRRHLYRGSRLECPCCGGHYRRFVTRDGDRDAICPGCFAAERHRTLWLFLSRETDVTTGAKQILHFAPEPGLVAKLGQLPGYVSADLEPGRAMRVMDIVDIPLEDESVDVIICNHVLEHVRDDRAALRELRRVLRPDGVAYMQHGIVFPDGDTYEDPSIVSPEGRLRAFGQEDHFRAYGRDFDTRLEAAGFTVGVVRYESQVSGEERRRFALGSDPIHVCKPAVLGAN